MKAIGTLALMIISLIFVSSCATEWLVDIDTQRIEVVSPGSNGLTAAEAMELFRSIAGQLGFDIQGRFLNLVAMSRSLIILRKLMAAIFRVMEPWRNLLRTKV